MRQNKTVIIGIDGVPFHLIDELASKNVMPHFKDLLNDGVFCSMESTIPEISSASWSSIITGKNPGDHGIYGFTDLIPNTYTLSFPNFRNLKAEPFWHILNNMKHVIINVPSTYPASELNGFLVSGFVSLDLEKAVFPSRYIDILKKIKYSIDVDSNKAHKSLQLFIKNLLDVHKKRVKLYRYLWDKIKWDIFMLVFTGSDRLEHFMWDAFEEKNHDFHESFLRYFYLVDKEIGVIKNKLSENDKLLILSDHGMERIKVNVNVNSFLEQEGMLKLGGVPKKRYNDIQNGSLCFALDPARIYINQLGRYPKGFVETNSFSSVKEDIVEKFHDFKYKGRRVIGKIYRKEEIYRGKYIKEAPDVVLVPNNGFSLHGGIGKKEIFQPPDIIKGKHTQPDAFLYVKNKDNQDNIPPSPSVENVMSILDLI